MKRAAIAFCVDVDPRRFDHYVFRDKLPFPAPVPPANYTLENAYDLRLFLDLMTQGGVSMDQASEIVASGTDKLMVHPLNQNPGAADLWVGAALIHDPDLGEGNDAFHTFFVAGTMIELAVDAEATAKEYGDKSRLMRVIAANASAAARLVAARAHEMGLPEAADIPQIETRAAYNVSIGRGER
ncbi:MAG: hypothetical protein Q7J44_11560 [Pseudotabrizicola sp.]|uniref:hypothetical protein n=1 Tax=Pseudotabrizicola sp. TaxID=2939647 RepID=UPI00271616A1|nr:hypothetical protein [Pseudotabrizicola sp.]MDO9639167.1 hypothetical protein [Pseudotabrizicola sp.]